MLNWYESHRASRNRNEFTDLLPIFSSLQPEKNLLFKPCGGGGHSHNDLVISTDLDNINQENILVASQSGVVSIWEFPSILDTYVNYMHDIMYTELSFPLGYIPTEEETQVQRNMLANKTALVNASLEFQIPNLAYCKWLNIHKNQQHIVCCDLDNNLLLYDLCSLKKPLVRKKHATVNNKMKFMITSHDYTSYNMSSGSSGLSSAFVDNNSSSLITCFSQKEMNFFDIRIGHFIGSCVNTRNISCASYLPSDANYLILGTLDGQIQCWDTRFQKSPCVVFSNIRRQQFGGTKSNRLDQLMTELNQIRLEREQKRLHNISLSEPKKPKYSCLPKSNLHSQLGFQSETDMWDFVRTPNNSDNTNLSVNPASRVKNDIFKLKTACQTLTSNNKKVFRSLPSCAGRFTTKTKNLKGYGESDSHVSLAELLGNLIDSAEKKKTSLRQMPGAGSAHRHPVDTVNFVQCGRRVLSTTLTSANPDIFTGKDYYKLWHSFEGSLCEVYFDIPPNVNKAPTLNEIHQKKLLADRNRSNEIVYSAKCDIVQSYNQTEYLLSGFGTRLLVHDVTSGELLACPFSAHTNPILAVYCPTRIIDTSAAAGAGLLTIDYFGNMNCWKSKKID